MEVACDLKINIGKVLASTYDPHFVIQKNDRGRHVLYFTAHDSSTFQKLRNLLQNYPDPDTTAHKMTTDFTRKIIQYANITPMGNCVRPFDQFMDKLSLVLDVLVQQNPDMHHSYRDIIEHEFTHLMIITQNIPVFIDRNWDTLNKVIDEICENLPNPHQDKTSVDKALENSNVTLREWFDANIKVRIVCKLNGTSGDAVTTLHLVDESAKLDGINIKCGLRNTLSFAAAMRDFRFFIENWYFTDRAFSRKMTEVYTKYSEMYCINTEYACQRMSQDLTKLLDTAEGQNINNLIGDLGTLFSKMFSVDLEEKIL